jgi:hypothetical protein
VTVRGGRWEATSASVRGAAHERDGRPNQDSVRVVEVGESTPGLVAAVCDGHGGDRYVRSDVGSRFGTEVACDIGRRFLAAFGSSSDLAEVRSQLHTRVTVSVVERWRERVIDDARRRPFTDHERTRARTRADLGDDPLIAYGCTLVLAIAGPQWLAFVQIGDGDVTVVRGADADGPMPPDDRLVGGETTSLCLPTAVADARIQLLGEPLPDIVILSSDGYANSFASPTWRSESGVDLRRQIDDFGLAQVEAHLPGWLSESARAGGDDVSMALIRRRDAATAWLGSETTVRNETLAAPSSSPSSSPTATLAPARRSATRRTRPRAVLLSAVPALAIGLGGGWLLGRGGQGDAPTASATTVTSTNPTVTSPVTSAPPSTRPVTTTAPTISPLETSPPTTVPVAGTAVPSTDGTTDPTIDVTGEIVVLSGNSGEGWLLQFDSAAPQPVDGRVVLLGTVRSSKPVVPLRWGMSSEWRFDGAQLCFGADSCTPAVGVLWPGEEPRDPDLVWATDTRLLWSFAAGSGEQVGCAIVTGSAATDPATEKGDSALAPGDTTPAETTPGDTTPDTPSTAEGSATCEPSSTDPMTPPPGTTTAPDEENN